MARKPSAKRKPASRRSGRRRQPRPLATIHYGWLTGGVLLALALFTLLSLLFPSHGVLTMLWLNAVHSALGWGSYLLPLGLLILGIWAIARDTSHPIVLRWNRVFGFVLLLWMSLGLSHHLGAQVREGIVERHVGGYVGYWTSHALTNALGWAGATVVLLAGMCAALILALEVSAIEVIAAGQDLASRIAEWAQSVRQKLHERTRVDAGHFSDAPSALVRRAPTSGASGVAKGTPSSTPTRREKGAATLSSEVVLGAVQWALPRLEDILQKREEAQMSLGDMREKARIIEDTLRSLGVPVTVVEVNPGPVVTQFGLEPGYVERRERDGKVRRAKVKVSNIAALANDLALALAAAPLRIEAPVPGKAIVGLEIPNAEPAVVGLREVMESDEFRASDSLLTLALGRNVSGEALADDLATLPHLLIAGATGSGKSVAISAMIACLLLRNTPDDLRLLMVDPKRVELTNFNGIPHLLAPVVVEAERVVGVLEWVTREMDRRYRLFARVGVRNLQGYNQWALARGEEKMPCIILFIDELADLMMAAPEQVERSLCRIAQIARATGIHLVIATQRPSVDVLTGLIKANFPARLCFAVSSQIDSRVVLDTLGAEKLLGRGDSLYMAPDSPKLSRVQGCFVSDEELTQLVTFWKGQLARNVSLRPELESAAAELSPPLVQKPLWEDLEPKQHPAEDEDPLLQEAIALVTQEKRASVSFLQRRLRIGYTRAGRLIDLLEEKGIIGPATGNSKAREVLAQAEQGQERSSKEGKLPG